jgi:hypothetical protein
MSDEVKKDELENTTVSLESQGAFMQSLLRNNKKIRDDRALAIGEAAEMMFKRTVEDMQLEIKQLKRERDTLIDLSPTTTDSLVLVSDFNPREFVEKDIALGVKIRNLEIKLDIATARYQYLFGGK